MRLIIDLSIGCAEGYQWSHQLMRPGTAADFHGFDVKTLFSVALKCHAICPTPQETTATQKYH